MIIQAIIHADHEPLDTVGIWAEKRGHFINVARPYAGEKLPSPQEFDMLVIMGGPQCAYELDIFPYLLDEIALIQAAIKENKAVLGICLGAQLIGAALGARALTSPEREIGIFPVMLLPESQEDPIFKGFSHEFDVMHWHNDMAGLPEGATVLGYSAGCPHQIIRFKKRVYGLQCHFEMSFEVAKKLIEHCPEDLKPAPFTQNKEQILAADFGTFNGMMMTILDRFSEL